MTDSNPEKGELDLKDDLNPEGDEDIKDEDLDFLDEDQDEEKTALDIFNKKVGKKYKSWDDVAKSERQRDKEFAQKPQPKKPENVVPQNYKTSERLLTIKHPESEYILDRIKKEHPNEDPFDVWENSEFYRNEASALAEKKRSEERISNPTGADGGEEDDFEKKMSKKFMRNFPPGVIAPKINK